MFSIKPCFASGIEKLLNYSEGSMSNVNRAAIVKDQAGGYMTGGSVLLRGPKPKTLQPLIVQTPRFNFDACTGSADFRFGGISYVSTAEFTRFFKSLASATGAYAVKMLIKTACPQCEDIMSYLETISRDINGLMMDQCSAAQKIAGGVFGALTNAGHQQCMMQGNMNGSNRDMYESTEKCKSDPDRHGNPEDKEETKLLLGNEFNLVWKAISKNNESLDTAFREMIMSVSGTIIGKKENGKFTFTPKPSLVLSNDLLGQYIGIKTGGSKLKLYQCNEGSKCLDPKEVEKTLTREETLYGNVSKILSGLIPKVLANKEESLTPDEEAVIAFSSIPLINLIEIELAGKTKSDDMLVRMNEFIEVVCYDVITNFLSQMVTKAQSSVESLQYSQVVDIKPIREFTERAEHVKSFLRDEKFAAFKRLQILTQVKERLKQQEKAFETTFMRSMQSM